MLYTGTGAESVTVGVRVADYIGKALTRASNKRDITVSCALLEALYDLMLKWGEEELAAAIMDNGGLRNGRRFPVLWRSGSGKEFT